MSAVSYARQSGIVSQETLTRPLAIIGAGGIGSFTALTIAKMGYEGPITVYDDDTIDPVNLPNQFYRLGDVGRDKVTALQDIVKEFADRELRVSNSRLDQLPIFAEIVVLAVDSMDTRIRLWRSLTADHQCRFVVDGRMGGESLRLYTIDRQRADHVALYEAQLYSSEQATPLRCTERAVIYNVTIIAGLIANQVKRLSMGQPYQAEILLHLGSLSLIMNS